MTAPPATGCPECAGRPPQPQTGRNRGLWFGIFLVAAVVVAVIAALAVVVLDGTGLQAASAAGAAFVAVLTLTMTAYHFFGS